MSNKNEVTLNIALSDSIITPMSCSLLVTGLVKYIIYQKQLIPYPYDNLKFYVSKRRALENNENESDFRKILDCAASERYYKKTSDALNTIESFLESISQEILNFTSNISEVLLLLGSNPSNPEEVYQIVLPILSYGHSDANHSTRKPLDNLMKNIFTDDILNKVLSRSPTCKNMYVLLKLKGSKSYHNEDYIQRDFRIPAKSHLVSFNFNTPVLSTDECRCVIPYEDSVLSFEDLSLANISTTDSEEFVWYQNKFTLKSFQEVQFKGSSVVNYWVNPSTFK